MFGLDAVCVRRCATFSRRTTSLRAHGDDIVSSKIPSAPYRRIDRMQLSPAVSTKRPEPRFVDQNHNGSLKSLMSDVKVMRPRLIKGLSKDEARKYLVVLHEILDYSLMHRELVVVSEALGLIVSRSPMTPSDVEFPSIIHKLTEASEHRLAEFSPGELCRLVWTYGCFGPSVLQPKFRGVKHLVFQICFRLETDRMPSLPMTVLLFHGLQRMKLSGFSEMTYQLLIRMGPLLKYPETGMDDMARLVLLAGKLRVENGHQFLRQAGRAAKHRMKEFSDTALKDLVQGFVFYDITMMPNLFDVLTEEVRLRSDRMSISTLIEITLGVSKIQYLPEDNFLLFFMRRIAKTEVQLTPKAIACCIQAMGLLGMRNPKLNESLRARLMTRLSKIKTIDICNALLGLVRLDALDKESLMSGLAAIHKELVNGVTKNQRLALHQVLTHAKLFLEIDVIPNEIFPDIWQSACRDAWIKDQLRSMYNKEASILKTLHLLGLEWREETSQIGDIKILVIQSPHGDQSIVLDVLYRKKHCYINQRHRPIPLPWKQWQWRVLKQQGYEILTIHEDEWMQVPQRSKLRHLGTKLGFWSERALIDLEYRLGIRAQTQSQ